MNPCWIFFVALLSLYPNTLRAQHEPVRPTLTLENLRHKDLSTLWIGPISLIDRKDSEALFWRERPEPIGYIGTDFQRFDIHFTEVGRSVSDPLKYELRGYTRTNNTICRFEGELHIDSLLEYPPCDAPDYANGIWSGWYLKGHYQLREHPDLRGSGILEGEHNIQIAVDERGNIYYDTLYLVADGYENNQWEGIWRSYSTEAVKTCNWGDFRIPNSLKLDVGCGEFIPDEAYRDKGWQSYYDYYNAWSKDDRFWQASAKELQRWWQTGYR